MGVPDIANESCQTRRMYGHDYAIPGTYEVTMVVAGRRPVFGEIVGSTKAGGETPHLKPSALGQAVLNDEIPKIHHFYPMVAIWQVCLMPDHLHMIVRINTPLPEGKHLGIIIGAFKGGVSRAWWRLTGMTEANATATVENAPATVSGASAAEKHWALAAAHRPPLFEPNYNDHILMRDGQLDNWKHYLHDNPRRLMIRHEFPDLFQRALCIIIDGIRYSAFGNMLLLRQPWPEDLPSFTSDYERFHYLNRLAETVCAVSHTTDVSVQGLRHGHGG